MSVMAKNRKPAKRKGEPLSVYLPAAVWDALDRYVEASRPRTSKTAVTTAALEDFLAAAGFYERAAGAKPSPD